MQLLESYRLSAAGEEKSLRLYLGDLSDIPASEAVDVLVVSAVPNDYLPTPGSLIGALHRRGISVARIAADKEVDLRESFSSWVSRDLSASYPGVGFRRLLCMESIGGRSPAENVSGVFRALMPYLLADDSYRSLAMPLLGTGDQHYPAAPMLRAIFEASVGWLAKGLPLQTIKVVVHDPGLVPSLRSAFAAAVANERLRLAARSAGRPRRSRSRRRGLTLETFGAGEGGSEALPPAEGPPLGEELPPGPQPYDYFVSYAHSDGADVDVVVNGLQVAAPTLRVFQDKLELNPGQSWQAELDAALEACARVLVFYSPSYLASKMCLEEFNMARLRHRESPAPVLLPIYLRTAALPLYMRSLQFLDAREADHARLQAMIPTLIESA